MLNRLATIVLFTTCVFCLNASAYKKETTTRVESEHFRFYSVADVENALEAEDLTAEDAASIMAYAREHSRFSVWGSITSPIDPKFWTSLALKFWFGGLLFETTGAIFAGLLAAGTGPEASRNQARMRMAVSEGAFIGKPLGRLAGFFYGLYSADWKRERIRLFPETLSVDINYDAHGVRKELILEPR